MIHTCVVLYVKSESWPEAFARVSFVFDGKQKKEFLLRAAHSPKALF